MEWRDARSKSSRDNVPPLLDAVTNEELNHWLAHFIVEVRNRNGERYPGTTPTVFVLEFKDILERKEQSLPRRIL